MKQRKGKIWAWITWSVLTLCMVLSMASSAKADMGPKPSVEIRL